MSCWSQELIILFIAILLIAIGLFFWGIYKALKTKENRYAWAMLPFFILIGVMFIR